MKAEVTQVMPVTPVIPVTQVTIKTNLIGKLVLEAAKQHGGDFRILTSYASVVYKVPGANTYELKPNNKEEVYIVMNITNGEVLYLTVIANKHVLTKVDFEAANNMLCEFIKQANINIYEYVKRNTVVSNGKGRVLSFGQ